LSRLGLLRARSSISYCQIFDIFELKCRFAVWSTTRYVNPLIWCTCCSAGPLLEAGRPSGTRSWAGRVSVPIAPLKSSLRRPGSISIAFEVTTFGYRRGIICHERIILCTSVLRATVPGPLSPVTWVHVLSQS